jgi:hypothetical protein
VSSTPAPDARFRPAEESGGIMDRVLAAFRDEASSAGNPLDPITPMRLAFLTRDVLPVDPQVPQADVFTALWDQRADLADSVAAGLAEYRCAVAEFSKRTRLWGTVRAGARTITGLSAMTIAGALAYALITSAALTHENIVVGLACGALGCLLGTLASLAAHNANGLAQRRYTVAYREFVPRLLVPEIASLAQQAIQLKDEQSRGVLLAPMSAPSLVESGTPAIVQPASFREVLGLVDGHLSSAIGVVGSRGAGKSTLLRLLCSSTGPERASLSSIGRYVVQPLRTAARPAARIGVSLTAPADPAAGDFVKVIYATTVRKILASNNVSAGGRRGWRSRFSVQAQDEIALAQQALERITGSLSLSRSKSAGLTEYGLSASVGRQRTWTERELSHADWVAEFRDYLERHHLRGGAPILIAIDELDKIADAARATEIINGLKDLFHVDGVHFVISVSDDALRSFATRGIPVRDTFDSAFDTVIEIPPMTAPESCELLRARVRYFPYSAALFCHAWSGGLPRDLIRTARSCVTVLNESGGPVPIADLAQRIIRRDLLHFLDAAISQQDQADVAVLLKFRHDLVDGAAVPSLPQDTAAANGSGVLASLGPYFGIASATGQYFAVSRTDKDWASGLSSGALHNEADLLAQAKAGLSVHPAEAAWRLARARENLSPEPRGERRRARSDAPAPAPAAPRRG